MATSKIVRQLFINRLQLSSFHTEVITNKFSSRPNSNVIQNLQYRLMREEDIDEVFDLVSNTFAVNNPLINAMKMPPNIFMQIFNNMRKQYLDQDLTYIAVDQNNSSGKSIIAGCKLCDDYYADLFNKASENFQSSSENKLDERWVAILKELDSMRKEVQKVVKPQLGIMCHIALGATRTEYLKMGINTKLTELHESLAIKRGFKYLISESASE